MHHNNYDCYLFVHHAALDPFIFVACFQWNGIHAHFTTVVTTTQPIFFDTFQCWITPWKEVSAEKQKFATKKWKPVHHTITWNQVKKIKLKNGNTLCHREHAHGWHDWRTMRALVVLRYDHLEIEPRISQAPSWSTQLLKFSAFFHVLFVKQTLKTAKKAQFHTVNNN